MQLENVWNIRHRNDWVYALNYYLLLQAEIGYASGKKTQQMLKNLSINDSTNLCKPLTQILGIKITFFAEFITQPDKVKRKREQELIMYDCHVWIWNRDAYGSGKIAVVCTLYKNFSICLGFNLFLLSSAHFASHRKRMCERTKHL